MPSNLWLTTEYAHSWLENLLYVACVTDVPCHLWLRWTDKEEHIHPRQKDRRGVLFLSVPDYCFVEWQEVEQNEAGDTIHHTFNFDTWGTCQRRWWHLRGQIGGADSPSTSPIFTAHYEEQEKAMSLKHTDLIDKNPGGIIDHADDSVTAAKLEPDLDGQPKGLNADKVDGKHLTQILLADLQDVSDAPSDGQVLTWDAATSLWKPAAPATGITYDTPFAKYPCDTLDGWACSVDAAPSAITTSYEGFLLTLRNDATAWARMYRRYGGIGLMFFDRAIKQLWLARPYGSTASVDWYLIIGQQGATTHLFGFRLYNGNWFGFWRGPAGTHTTAALMAATAGSVYLLEAEFSPATYVRFRINGGAWTTETLDLPNGVAAHGPHIYGDNGSAVTKHMYIFHIAIEQATWWTS